jgi:hypothetical protein
VKVWVLHPKYEGKVIAEAYAGINHKSRCMNDEQDLCKKGQQMINVIKVFYSDTPVMFSKDGRFPKHIGFLDQVEGLPNTPILWGVPYLMQIPTMEEITRMMGNITSAACGRVMSTATDQAPERNTPEPTGKKANPLETAKGRNTGHLKNKTETRKSDGKKVK